jgi:hypothetical protein
MACCNTSIRFSSSTGRPAGLILVVVLNGAFCKNLVGCWAQHILLAESFRVNPQLVITVSVTGEIG